MPNVITSPPETDAYSLLAAVEQLAQPGAVPSAGTPEARVAEMALAEADTAVRARAGAALPTRGLVDRMGVRKLNSGRPDAGGNLVAQATAAVAAAVRPVLVLEAAGGQVLEAAGAEDFSLPVMTPDLLNAGWISEMGAASGPLFHNLKVSSVSFTAKGAAARIAYSRRVAKSAAQLLEPALLAEVKRAVSDTVEAGFFAGTGSNNQPLGIINTPGLQAETFAATDPTAAELLAMLEAVGDADAPLTACRWILHPSDVVLQLAAGRIVWVDGAHRLYGLPVLASGHVPEKTYLVGDWSVVLMPYFGPPQVIVDGFSNGKSITGNREIVVINYCDVGLTHPEHLAIGKAA